MLARPQLEHDRGQHALRLDGARRQALGDLLEQDALVGHMLVDDRQALFIRGDDERIPELAQRHHRPEQFRKAGRARDRAHGCLHHALVRARNGRGGGAESQRQRPGRRRPDGHGLGRQREPDLRRAAVAQGVHDRAAQNFVHQALIEETHLGLGRMDVHVHAVGRKIEEQMHLGAAFLDRRDAVRLLNGVGDRAIAHHAPVHKDMLRSTDGALLAERRHVTAHRHPSRVLANRHEIGTVAVDLKEALFE